MKRIKYWYNMKRLALMAKGLDDLFFTLLFIFVLISIGFLMHSWCDLLKNIIEVKNG